MTFIIDLGTLFCDFWGMICGVCYRVGAEANIHVLSSLFMFTFVDQK